jgi:transcriptional regulator with XRE-family HTH domain
MTLRELRKARKLTQVRMARKLKITQDGVSRLEKRSDLLCSLHYGKPSRRWAGIYR